jgi:hypothetical protein
VVKAAPSILPRGCDKAPLDRIPVNVADHFGLGRFSPDVRVEITLLPELLAVAFEPAGGDLLERLEKRMQGGSLIRR